MTLYILIQNTDRLLLPRVKRAILPTGMREISHLFNILHEYMTNYVTLKEMRL